MFNEMSFLKAATTVEDILFIELICEANVHPINTFHSRIDNMQTNQERKGRFLMETPL